MVDFGPNAENYKPRGATFEEADKAYNDIDELGCGLPKELEKLREHMSPEGMEKYLACLRKAYALQSQALVLRRWWYQEYMDQMDELYRFNDPVEAPPDNFKS